MKATYDLCLRYGLRLYGHRYGCRDQFVIYMIPPLQAPDFFHLQAAQGWLDLGNQKEADQELEKVAPQNRIHPAVLRLRWDILAEAKKWAASLNIATTLIEVAPDDALGWLQRASSLHELKRTQEARDTLLSVVEKFSTMGMMQYGLACYECQLGHLRAAKDWLEIAVSLDDTGVVGLSTLVDPELEPLWKGIPNL